MPEGAASDSIMGGGPCTEPADHCQSRVASDALNSSRTQFLVAENFVPLADGMIASVCWWGAYLDQFNAPCQNTSSNSFRVRYFNDNNGMPGTMVGMFSQQDSTLSVTPPFATGNLIAGFAPEYEFHATHAAIPVTAGSCYWMEITNIVTGCTWFWELGVGDNRSFQDATPGDGYAESDALIDDLAFCLDVPLQAPDNCNPPAPPNDDCTSATSIIGPGVFSVDTTNAGSSGPDHNACLLSGQAGIDRDAWYQWTSTCDGQVLLRTCQDTSVDTKLAVYGSASCPNTSNMPVSCNDDLCGPQGLQSMVAFQALTGNQYLLRIGSFPGTPGGLIHFEISCGPPDHPACPGAGSCCQGQDHPGCDDTTCCETVCACDPFCCDVEWDADCASNGFAGSGCGAGPLCGCGLTCGNPNAGSCCVGQTSPGCSDVDCCEAVCKCDAFCCDVEWDSVCAGNGFNESGCGAASLCPALCAAVPTLSEWGLTVLVLLGLIAGTCLFNSKTQPEQS